MGGRQVSLLKFSVLFVSFWNILVLLPLGSQHLMKTEDLVHTHGPSMSVSEPRVKYVFNRGTMQNEGFLKNRLGISLLSSAPSGIDSA